MPQIQPLLNRDDFEDTLNALADTVIESVGESLNREDSPLPDDVLDDRGLEDGDTVLFLNSTDKYDIIDVINNTDEFERALQSFVEYGDDGQLNATDWNDIQDRARNGGYDAFRKHAERLAYYEVVDRLNDRLAVFE